MYLSGIPHFRIQTSMSLMSVGRADCAEWVLTCVVHWRPAPLRSARSRVPGTPGSRGPGHPRNTIPGTSFGTRLGTAVSG
jgi:hypothetical protein